MKPYSIPVQRHMKKQNLRDTVDSFNSDTGVLEQAILQHGPVLTILKHTHHPGDYYRVTDSHYVRGEHACTIESIGVKPMHDVFQRWLKY